MIHTIKCDYKEDMYFEAEVDGYKIPMDASPEFGGKDRGARPKPILLAALSGCTGMDVVSMLNKMKIPFSSLHIEVDGTLTDDHPKYYKEIHITYKLNGNNLSYPEIEKAVKLSIDKYCGVIGCLKHSAKISYSIHLA